MIRYRSLLSRCSEDLLDLLAPRLCPSCDERLGPQERSYCRSCRYSLEVAPYPRELYGDMLEFFPEEELAISAIGSLYLFRRGGAVQRIVHALKYHGCYRLGIDLGEELGSALGGFREFSGIDLIVPVPLHRARRRERGYNQSEAIARGVARHVGAPFESRAVARMRNTRSQTTLGASSRLGNVHDAFIAAPRTVSGRTVLLCDDVCTTGATLNACADALLIAGATSVVAATIAKDA